MFEVFQKDDQCVDQKQLLSVQESVQIDSPHTADNTHGNLAETKTGQTEYHLASKIASYAALIGIQNAEVHSSVIILQYPQNTPQTMKSGPEFLF